MAIDKLPTSQISGNTLAVTANSGSSISASNINFSNTSTVSVSVEQGPTGTANVSFTSSGPGISLAKVIALGG